MWQLGCTRFVQNSGWSEIVSGTDYFDISGDYTLVITEDVLKSLQEGGLIIGGHDYTAVAVYLENNGTALDPNKDYAFYIRQIRSLMLPMPQWKALKRKTRCLPKI